ncbi:TraB/GumN family protein [Qipengyuania sp. 1NDH17]|uniref:TraB/GumN family protein n=2 Tax=Qipengyuania polymorpha TaxID=2867234 RepID=A0ABS7IV44_9SPHN|nr:TraB/GumN family protein [Qipengyuania polymorpha]
MRTINAPAPQQTGPALWKVEDEDTTIYLFGTVHILPANVQWFSGNIARALETSDTLVTEIPEGAMDEPAMKAAVVAKGTLPEGKTLRGLLNPEQRQQYEAALTQLGAPADAFDRYEPWLAGITLAVMPLIMNGYDPESGAESVIEAAAPADATRLALETAEQQLDFFDKLPPKSQVAFLMSSAKDLDRVVAMMDEMLNEWLEGDADSLAALMNSEMTDPVAATVLLHTRNERWAEWIDARMDEPGQVFIAVGAGHLAGEKSVQDYLAQRDITVTRIQ